MGGGCCGKMTSMKKRQKEMPYVSAVMEYVSKNRTPFKMPGHKGGKGMHPSLKKIWGESIFKYDLAEVDGLDNVNVPTGVIKDAEELASQAFGSKATFFLVNGSTLGNQIAILTCVKKGEKILIARDAHQSVYVGLLLSGAVPVYVRPTLHKKSGLYGVVGSSTIADILRKNRDVTAVHITSPSQTGFLPDIKEISKFAHSKHIPLLVDEASGAHFGFHPSLPESAIKNADIIVQSTHKTIGSLTQSAMLHIGKKSNISGEEIRSYIQLLQSSSPSTLLVMSLDGARQQMAMRGYELLEETLSLARYARSEINKTGTFFCYGREVAGTYDIADMDETRLLIDVSMTGYSGQEFEKLLGENYGIEIEMSDARHILCYITLGDCEKNIDKLLRAFKRIRRHASNSKISQIEIPPLPDLPDIVLSPRKAFFAKKQAVSLREAIGRTCAEFVVAFPPDMPIIVPGEKITKEIVKYIARLKGNSMVTVGMQDISLETIVVVK